MGFGKDGTGAIITEQRTQLLGALSPSTGIIVGTKLAITKDFRDLKVEVSAAVTDLTAGEGEALQLYLVNGDLTLAEFEESIEINGPLDRFDTVGDERAMRYSTVVGGSEQPDPAGTQVIMRDAHTNAPVCVAKPRWTFGELKSWNWIIYNSGLDALTTGASVRVKAKHYGVWLS